MEIKQISEKALGKLAEQDGLIIQGCGGDLQDWVNGINDLFTEAEILRNDSRFDTVYTFQRDKVTNLLFPFDGVDVDGGKLAMWRIKTHDTFHGTWFSDYVENHGLTTISPEQGLMELQQ